MEGLRIPIIMAANDLYLPCAAVSICSMIDTKRADTIYEIHILHTGLDAGNMCGVESMSRADVLISFQNISALIESYMPRLYSRAHFSREMYFRWWIAEAFPQFDKALYLDCDTIVFCDLATLYETELKMNAVGGVTDFATPAVCQRITRQLGLPAEQYINTGVLLINSAVWRSEHFLDSCLIQLERFPVLSCPDHDILNMVCKGRIIYLDARWNVQWQHLWDTENDRLAPPFLNMFLTAIEHPNILHFTSPTKPWNCAPTPYADPFFRYAKQLSVSFPRLDPGYTLDNI